MPNLAKRYSKLRNPQAKLRLVCLHHAAGSAPMYLNWVSELPLAIELSVIELPGRGETLSEPAFDNIALASQAVAQTIHDEVATPYVIFGHGLGALIGFEAIHYLEKNTLPLPLHFFASGCSAPHVFLSEQRRDLLSKEELIHLIASYDKYRMEQHKMYYGFLETMLPALREDFQMNDGYQFIPERLLSCPITACAGLTDKKNPEITIQAWQKMTNKNFSYQLFPGGHMYLFDHRTEFLRWLSEELHFLMR